MKSPGNRRIKVVCMGDSITEGYCLERGEEYPARLQALLGDACEVVNKGVCSSTALNVTLCGEVMGLPYMRQERYWEALAEKGDIYVIMLGTNDAQDGRDDEAEFIHPLHNMISRKAEFVPCYQAIIDGVRKAAPDAAVYVAIPIPIRNSVWPKHREAYLQELMPCFAELLRQNPDVCRIDVHGAFEALGEEGMSALYREDNLHPNARGAALIAKTVCEAIKGQM